MRGGVRPNGDEQRGVGEGRVVLDAPVAGTPGTSLTAKMPTPLSHAL
jgi:hypothetical protein